jgi:hypothetical protein
MFLGGVIVYVTGIATRFFIDPYQEYLKAVGEIERALVYHANVSGGSKAERQEKASTVFRQKSRHASCDCPCDPRLLGLY